MSEEMTEIISSPVLTRYESSIIKLVTDAKELSRLVSIARDLLKQIDAYSAKPMADASEFRKVAEQNASASKKAEEFFQTVADMMFDLEPEVLALVAEKFSSIHKESDKIITYHLSRNVNLAKPQAYSKKALHKEYCELRETLVSVGKILKVKVNLEARSGNYSDEVNVAYTESRFYSYMWTVNEVAYDPGTDWFVIARAVDFPLAMNGKIRNIGDFIEFLDHEFDLQVNDKNLNTDHEFIRDADDSPVIRLEKIK